MTALLLMNVNSFVEVIISPGTTGRTNALSAVVDASEEVFAKELGSSL